MQLEPVSLGPGAWLVVGRTLASTATILSAGRDAVLIDGLGSAEDAAALAEVLAGPLSLRVRVIIATHYFSDHMAAFRHFPEADIWAHARCRETYDRERDRDPECRFLEPAVRVDAPKSLQWGDFQLEVFPNPGMTPCMLNVDIPALDVVHGGDNLTGPVVYLRYARVEDQANALQVLEERQRRRLLLSHVGIYPREIIRAARHYLDALAASAASYWSTSGSLVAPLHACLAPGAIANPDEVGYHAANLEAIVERGLWRPDEGAPSASLPG